MDDKAKIRALAEQIQVLKDALQRERIARNNAQSSSVMKEEFEALKETLKRERGSRKASEKAIEDRSKELFRLNEKLRKDNRENQKRDEEFQSTKALRDLVSKLKNDLQQQKKKNYHLSEGLSSQLKGIKNNLDQFGSNVDENKKTLSRTKGSIKLAKENIDLYNEVNELLENSYISTHELCSLDNLIENLIDSYSNMIKVNNIEVEMNLDKLPSKFNLDKLLFNYYISNLMYYFLGNLSNTKLKIDSKVEGLTDDTFDLSFNFEFILEQGDLVILKEDPYEFRSDTGNHTYFNIVFQTNIELANLMKASNSISLNSNILKLGLDLKNIKYEDPNFMIVELPKKEKINSLDEPLSLVDEIKLQLKEAISPILSSKNENEMIDFANFLKSYQHEQLNEYAGKIEKLIDVFDINGAKLIIDKLNKKI